MDSFEAEIFKVNLKNRQDRAWKLVSEITRMHDMPEQFRDDDFIDTIRDKKHQLSKEVSQLKKSVTFALERLGSDGLAERLSNEKLYIVPSGDPDWEGVSCPALKLIDEYSQAILDNYDIRYGLMFHLEALEKRLKNTPRILQLLDVDPTRENDVKQKMHEYLRIEYGDAVNEVSLPRGVRTFRPDTGIRSLYAAIEYKFADSEQEARNHLEQIYADVGGYEGFKDFTNFFAVLYMTRQFLTQEEIDHMFQKLPRYWKIVSVVGHGSRQ